jgi:hypothetical protein
VSLTLARRELPVPIGLRLLLPSAWIDDPARCARAGVPEAARIAQTKPQITLAENDRLMAAGLRFGCVLAGAGYGSGAPFRQGLGGAVFGVITPLVAADITGRGRWFNLRMGILGLAVGLAATVSNMAAGAIASSLGVQTAFIALALAGICAVMAAGFGMPETQPLAAVA